MNETTNLWAPWSVTAGGALVGLVLWGIGFAVFALPTVPWIGLFPILGNWLAAAAYRRARPRKTSRKSGGGP